MGKFLHIFGILVALVFLVSCSNVNEIFDMTPTSSVDSAKKLHAASTNAPLPKTKTLTSTNTETNIPTRQPTQTPAPTRTTTGIPSPQWGNTLEMVHFEGNYGYWAETQDSFLYVLVPFDMNSDRQEYTLSVANAPEFASIQLSPEIKNGAYNLSFMWSLDSQSIVYACLPEEYYPTLCIMDADGKNSKVINPEIRAMNYIWPDEWMDRETLIFSEYSGGGHVDLKSVNIATGKLNLWEAGINGDVQPANNIYIPATGNNGWHNPNVVVVSKAFTYRDFSELEGDFIFGNVRHLPDFQSKSWEATSSKFEDWLPNSNQLLISWTYIIPSSMETQENGLLLEHNLLLWNLENNTLRLIAPSGRGGKFSSDGNLLIYLTSGPAKPDYGSKPIPEKLKPSGSEFDYMQLLDMRSGKVSMSIPIAATFDVDLPEWQLYGHGNLCAQFSPDGRYLSFLTPGKVVENPKGWPARVEINDATPVMLNLLDLKEKKIIWSTPSIETAETFWSPTSKFMIYQDIDLNWQLFDIDGYKSIPITLKNGQEVIEPAWSHNGHYFSLEGWRNSLITIIKVDKNK